MEDCGVFVVVVGAGVVAVDTGVVVDAGAGACVVVGAGVVAVDAGAGACVLVGTGVVVVGACVVVVANSNGKVQTSFL